MLNGSNATFAWWMDAASGYAGNQRIVDKSSAAYGSNGYDLDDGPDLYINGAQISLGGTVTTGIWTEFAIVLNSGVGESLYENGSFVKSVTMTSTIPNVAEPAYVGASPSVSGRIFPGLIDDVRIYNRALSAAEIAAMYNGGK